MAESLRVGIIGAGWAGSSHAAAFTRLSEVKVTGLWSRTRSRAEDLAGKQNLTDATIYDSWEALVESDVNVISITTPAALRRDPIEMALERGLHVLSEKPFTPYLDEARALNQLAEHADTVTAVSFNWRYSPGYQVAYRALQQGVIGELRSVRKRWRLRFTGDIQAMLDASPWQKQKETGGGVLQLAGCQEFDEVRFLTGLNFRRTVARLTHYSAPGTSFEDSYLLLVELSNQMTGVLSFMMTAGQPEWQTILVGEEGTLVVKHEGVTQQCRDDGDPVQLEIPESDQVPQGVAMLQYTWNRLVEDFCTAIRQGDVDHKYVPHLPTFTDGMRTVELIAAAELSHAEGRWVHLDQLA